MRQLGDVPSRPYLSITKCPVSVLFCISTPVMNRNSFVKASIPVTTFPLEICRILCMLVMLVSYSNRRFIKTSLCTKRSVATLNCKKVVATSPSSLGFPIHMNASWRHRLLLGRKNKRKRGRWDMTMSSLLIQNVKSATSINMFSRVLCPDQTHHYLPQSLSM